VTPAYDGDDSPPLATHFDYLYASETETTRKKFRPFLRPEVPQPLGRSRKEEEYRDLRCKKIQFGRNFFFHWQKMLKGFGSADKKPCSVEV